MRSRLAITLMLVFGFALSGAGAGLAVDGLGETASTAQYRNGGGENPTLGGGGVKGETDTEDGDVEGQGNAGENPSPNGPGSGNAPSSEDGGVGGVQETRQVGAEEGGDELPFTGLAAIPILLIGLALVGSGLALRRGGRSAA